MRGAAPGRGLFGNDVVGNMPYAEDAYIPNFVFMTGFLSLMRKYTSAPLNHPTTASQES
jgi:hypothetical protein